MFPANPQCGSWAICIPLVACLLLIKLSLTQPEVTKKQLVCAKDMHDEAASCLEGICISLNKSSYCIEVFTFLFHLMMLSSSSNGGSGCFGPSSVVISILSLFLPLPPSGFVQGNKNARICGITL